MNWIDATECLSDNGELVIIRHLFRGEVTVHAGSVERGPIDLEAQKKARKKLPWGRIWCSGEVLYGTRLPGEVTHWQPMPSADLSS